MPGLIVTAPIRALISRHPELSVDVIRTTWDDQTDIEVQSAQAWTVGVTQQAV
jgi:hypothetical protein